MTNEEILILRGVYMKRKYYIKVWKDNELVRRVMSRKKRRISFIQKGVDFRKHGFKVYIKVDDGGGFYNDGYYTDRKSLEQAWRAFLEPA